MKGEGVDLDEYVEHLLAGDEEACLADGRALAVDVDGLRRLYMDVIQPSQYRVGELWESGRISVAREHVATAINTYVATACYAPLARAGGGGPGVVIACTSDEVHELGPRMVSDLLECDGWDTYFLGPSMPLRDLIGVVRERSPRFVGLSAALTLHLGSVKRTIGALRDELGTAAPPIMVGGNAFRDDPGLWAAVGADSYAPDAASAVEAARALKG
jgi:MerR family transcriptional regulator, light-induced transcriptional regulator